MAYASDLCGSKLRDKLTSTFNESSSQKISTDSFAAKQMAKMGWKEGTGLGKKRDGMASHIKVRKREDNVGLGLEKERTRQMGVEGMWWSSSVSDTLAKLQKKSKSGKDHKKSKKKRKSEKSDGKHAGGKPKVYTDEELFIATGGARFGMRSQRRAEGKWQRTEKSAELKELELKSKNQFEWNGLGKASIASNKKGVSSVQKSIEESRTLKKRKRVVDDDEKKDDTMCEKELLTREDTNRNSDSSSFCSDEKDSKKQKKDRKKRKKDKKHEKKLKKSKRKKIN